MEIKNRSAVQKHRDTIIQAGLQLIPSVGGALSTLYFGHKQEKRFERLETFYKEIQIEIEKMEDKIAPVNQQDPDQLEAIMESLHDKIEVEAVQEKRDFFKNYFKNTLRYPVNGNFDERKYFLEVLAEMTLLECQVFNVIVNSNSVEVGRLNVGNAQPYAVVGAVGRLKSRGFLVAILGDFTVFGEDNYLNESVYASPFGLTFFNFCLAG